MDSKEPEKPSIDQLETVTPDSGSEQESRYDVKATKRLLRKIDWVLLPFLSLLYLLSFLDRTNIGNARLAGLEKDLKLHGLMYNVVLAAFFPTYAFAEIPSNIMMKRLRPSIWIPSIMVAWGIVCVCMGLVTNYAGLLVARAFLGLTEGGLFPGIAFYITMWYRRHECGLRMAIFFSAATAAGAFGGLLARAIVMMDGMAGHPGWAWIFIIEGAMTLFVALSAFKIMQDYPSTAKFLTESERAEVTRRLEDDRDSLADEYDRKYVWQAAKDWKVYAFSIMGVGLSLPVYSISLFMPTIVKTLKYTNATAQLMTVPPYIVACCLCITGGYAADKAKQRGVFIMGFASIGIIGFLILMIATDPHVKYAGCFFVAGGIYPTAPQTIAWLGNNIGGSSKRAIAIAIYVMIGNLGALVSSFIYLPKFAPNYKTGHSILMASTSVSLGLAFVLTTYFRRENAKREKLRPAALFTREEKAEDRELGDYARFFRYTI